MRKTLLLAVTITLAALSAGHARAQSGYDLFQQGLVKERAEGNLDEAIKLYQRIAREYASDRTLAGARHRSCTIRRRSEKSGWVSFSDSLSYCQRGETHVPPLAARGFAA